jgi:hypothetical protein
MEWEMSSVEKTLSSLIDKGIVKEFKGKFSLTEKGLTLGIGLFGSFPNKNEWTVSELVEEIQNQHLEF